MVLSYVLVSMSMSSNDNGLAPPWHQFWNVFSNNWFSENSSVQDVPNCSIGGSPHFLELELLHSFFIRSNSSAFDSYFVLLYSVGSINGNLVVSLISVFHTQVEVFDV